LTSDVSTRPALEFLLPGDPQTLTGGYIYDRRILEGLAALGWQVRLHALDASFPFPNAPALEHARAQLEQIATGAVVVIDGLALGAMPKLIAQHADRLRLVALIHHPLADETGLAPLDRERLRQSERDALALVHTAIVTSRWTLRQLADRGVPVERLRVVLPGTDPAPLAIGSGHFSLSLLCVATLTPRKGHRVLFEALGQLRDRSWNLRCVGSLRRDVATVGDLQRQIADLGLTERIHLLGEVTQQTLDECYASADLFVLASYLEGYGMAHAEALSRGLPLVTTSAGAVAETVPMNAGVLVPPGDSHALARALASVMDDAGLRSELARGARHARVTLPTWPESCSAFDAELRALL
jgi:glycosyltransferase involved in cell wall biosynthesis